MTDRETFLPVTMAIHLLLQIRDHHPDDFDWGPEDRLNSKMGTDRFRGQVEAGETAEGILGDWEEERRAFEAVREAYLMY